VKRHDFPESGTSSGFVGRLRLGLRILPLSPWRQLISTQWLNPTQRKARTNVTPTPEIGLYAIFAGAALLLFVGIGFFIHYFGVANCQMLVTGNTPTRRPTLAPPDAEEAYLRENSILPHSPDAAQGNSDPFHQGGFRERRGTPRRSGNPVDVLLSDAKAEVEPLAGIVLDRSGTGLALELWAEGDVRPGTIITVRPRKASSDANWIRVIVRRCEQRKDSWALGCEFIRPPGAHAMMEFG